MQVAQYYQSVVIVLESEVGAALIKKYKDWVKLLSIKSSYYTAVAHVFQANSMEEQGNYGYMIAFQQLAVEKVRSIGKLPRNTPDSVKDAVKNLTEYLTLKLQESLRQNEQVFHELVPNLETLEPAPGIELVKPVVFQPSDPKIIGTDIFSRLVPMRAYEAASLYSEEQAKLMRSVVSSVDEKNEELNNFMTSLNISEVMDHCEDDATIPADIMSLHRQFQSKGTLVHNVKTKIQELVELSDRVEIQLTELHQRKEQEIQEEKEFQEKFDTKADEQTLNNLWKELESMGKYHKQASKSNNDLSEVFSQHSSNLLLFSGPTNSLVAAMPQVDMNNSIEESDKERVKMLLVRFLFNIIMDLTVIVRQKLMK
jgi:tyrosine-protein phosphatase non-receptor type 23